jgi:hypothetical protein
MWATILALVLAMEPPAPAAEAPPDDPAPVGAPIGLVAGTATAIVPLIVGGALMAEDQSPRLEAAGFIVMASGFALAPWVAHGVRGAWRRAAIYGGLSLALSAGAVVEMEESHAFERRIGNKQRIPTKILLPLAMGSSVLGVVMSLFDRDHAEPTARLSLWLVPAGGGFATGLGWSTQL